LKYGGNMPSAKYGGNMGEARNMAKGKYGFAEILWKYGLRPK
jgi:hypothetical protein